MWCQYATVRSSLIVPIMPACAARAMRVNPAKKAIFAGITPAIKQRTMLFPSLAEIRNLYLEVVRHPVFAEELSHYEAHEVRDHAQAVEAAAWEAACALMEGSPDYHYPEAYRNGREMEHFFERMSTAQESLRVQQALTDYPVKDKYPKLYSVRQAAKEIGISQAGLRKWVKEGMINSHMIDTFRCFAEADLVAGRDYLAYLNSKHAPAR